MRLISCVVLLMVIPAIGLLTKANKFTDEKMPDTPVHEQVTNDSITFNWFSRTGAVAKFKYAPVISTIDYQLSYFKPVHPNSSPSLIINK